MSWEYSINLDSEESVSSVVTDLKICELFSSSTTDYIDWKDSEPIDKNIFSALKLILAKYDYHLTDCDTDEEVTLEHIFRSVI